jgi:hypothetical protein
LASLSYLRLQSGGAQRFTSSTIGKSAPYRFASAARSILVKAFLIEAIDPYPMANTDLVINGPHMARLRRHGSVLWMDAELTLMSRGRAVSTRTWRAVPPSTVARSGELISRGRCLGGVNYLWGPGAMGGNMGGK